jgi:hypothetical protein
MVGLSRVTVSESDYTRFSILPPRGALVLRPDRPTALRALLKRSEVSTRCRRVGIAPAAHPVARPEGPAHPLQLPFLQFVSILPFQHEHDRIPPYKGFAILVKAPAFDVRFPRAFVWSQEITDPDLMPSRV